MTSEHTAATLAFNAWAQDCGWPAICDPGLSFEAAALGEILSVWRAQAGDDGIPLRSRLTARVLKPYLGYISIIERPADAPSRHRVRLFGMRLAENLGEMQGKYLEDVLAPEVVRHWQARIELALRENRPMRFVSRVDADKKYHLISESLWAPLRGDDRETPMVLMAAILKFNDQIEAIRKRTLINIA
jgi:hypothetical protein